MKPYNFFNVRPRFFLVLEKTFQAETRQFSESVQVIEQGALERLTKLSNRNSKRH